MVGLMRDRPSVVVIDDDSSVCKAVQRLLQIAQMDVQTYRSGEAFLQAARDPAPDCLVLDVRMPGMTGFELATRLHDSGWRIPIVFITAHDDKVPPGCGTGSVIPEVLLKPFAEEALLEAIWRAIRRAEGRGQ